MAAETSGGTSVLVSDRGCGRAPPNTKGFASHRSPKTTRRGCSYRAAISQGRLTVLSPKILLVRNRSMADELQGAAELKPGNLMPIVHVEEENPVPKIESEPSASLSSITPSWSSDTCNSDWIMSAAERPRNNSRCFTP